MYKCKDASTREIIAFQKTYCESLAAAIGMNNKFHIQVGVLRGAAAMEFCL